MDEIKRCPLCRMANPADATLCIRCHANLVPLLTARIGPDMTFGLDNPYPPDHQYLVKRLHPGSVLVVIAEDDQPIYLPKSQKIWLGRDIPETVTGRIEFDAVQAFRLGVSREHAVIECADDVFLIRDLESTNGTWLNDTKLIPHRAYKILNGDLIRLGQLGIYFYYPTKEDARKKDFVLVDLTTPTIDLTSEYLITKVGPYLSTLSDIHSIIDTALQRTHIMMTIKSLYVEPETATLHIDLTISDDLLGFLEAQVDKWRRQHRKTINRIRALEANIDWRHPESLDDPDPIAPDYLALRDQLYPALTQLCHDCLTTLAPELRDDERMLYYHKLLPLVSRLVHSPLHLTRQPILEVSP